MTNDRLSIGGAVVFWRLAKSTNRAQVQDGLNNLYLDEFTPEPRSPLACLRAAIPDVYPVEKGHKQATRPIKNGVGKGFAVVKEDPENAHAGDAWGTVRATAILEDETKAVKLDPFDHEKRDALKAGMAGAAEWLTAASVGTALVKLVEWVDGVALRPSGGVYWVREDRLEEWERIAHVFEQASAEKDREGNEQPPNAVYVMRVVADEAMVRAVGDALTADIEAELATIEQDIASGELREQACINRLKRTVNLEKRVKRYETAFDAPLTRLREACKRARVATAQATLESTAAGVA